jgi:hypothetical protein
MYSNIIDGKKNAHLWECLDPFSSYIETKKIKVTHGPLPPMERLGGFLFVSFALGIEPRAWHMSGSLSSAELHPSPSYGEGFVNLPLSQQYWEGTPLSQAFLKRLEHVLSKVQNLTLHTFLSSIYLPVCLSVCLSIICLSTNPGPCA